MELSDLHTPTCKLHASQSFEEHSPLAERRNSDASDIFLSPEAYKATQAVEFIAEHLRNEDEYVQVRTKQCKISYFVQFNNLIADLKGLSHEINTVFSYDIST
jgi:hypothetical protein